MISRIGLSLSALLFSILLVFPVVAQDTADACVGYETITISSPALVEEGVDLQTVRCTTIFVQSDEGAITHVFVIPESFVGAYLRGVDLRGTDIVGIDFSYANLRDAQLQQLSASAVMFIETDFTDADLSESDLTFGYLSYSVLVGANLTGADLTGAELTEADITDSDMTDTILDNVIGYEED